MLGAGADEHQCTRLRVTASAGFAVTARMASVDSQNESERHGSDLYTRPGWIDAVVALGQLDQVGYIYVYRGTLLKPRVDGPGAGVSFFPHRKIVSPSDQV